MMLDARVRTDEAIEATVCVDARALRRDWKSDSGFSCCVMSTSCHSPSVIGRLFPFKKYFHTTNVRMATTATPPTTPPAMAPTLGLLGADAPAVGSIWQPTEGQVSQVRDVCTQTLLDGHWMPSQDRAACLHSMQRLSNRKTFSASATMLVDY
jgi:hypothetical protein